MYDCLFSDCHNCLIFSVPFEFCVMIVIFSFKEEKERTKKKKRRKIKKEKPVTSELQRSPMNDPIDPDEQTYCSCKQISYGEMICCDNDDCAIEWFHFNCVNLTNKPKGKWYCPQCRGDKPTVKRVDIK